MGWLMLSTCNFLFWGFGGFLNFIHCSLAEGVKGCQIDYMLECSLRSYAYTRKYTSGCCCDFEAINVVSHGVVGASYMKFLV